MYPLSQKLSFNPIRDRWFRVIVTNEIWFLTVIYCAARQLSNDNPCDRYEKDASTLMDRILGRLRKSITDTGKGDVPVDAVVCAVACLTTIEVSNEATSMSSTS